MSIYRIDSCFKEVFENKNKNQVIVWEWGLEVGQTINVKVHPIQDDVIYFKGKIKAIYDIRIYHANQYIVLNGMIVEDHKTMDHIGKLDGFNNRLDFFEYYKSAFDGLNKLLVFTEELVDFYDGIIENNRKIHRTIKMMDIRYKTVGGEQCANCGKVSKIVWKAPDDIWKRITEEGGLLCTECFDALCASQGITLYWTCKKGKL